MFTKCRLCGNIILKKSEVFKLDSKIGESTICDLVKYHCKIEINNSNKATSQNACRGCKDALEIFLQFSETVRSYQNVSIAKAAKNVLERTRPVQKQQKPPYSKCRYINSGQPKSNLIETAVTEKTFQVKKEAPAGEMNNIILLDTTLKHRDFKNNGGNQIGYNLRSFGKIPQVKDCYVVLHRLKCLK